MADRVTTKQEIFCQEWVDEVGNGTYAALKAFDIEGKELLDIEEKDRTDEQKMLCSRIHNTAAVMATEYLRNPKLRKRIDEILDERGFNDDIVKQEHFKIIKHGKDEVKMRAISDYYKLKGKYQPEEKIINILTPTIEDKERVESLLEEV